MSHGIQYASVSLLGLLLGSFLNVLIYRLPRGESIAYPGSRCTECGTRLRPKDLIPLLSWLWLQGKCRYCGSRIPARYPLVEITTGLLYLALFVRFGVGLEFGLGLILLSGLIAVSGMDLVYRRIPNAVTVPLAVSGLIYSAVSDRLLTVQSLSGLAVGFFVLFLISLGTKGGMGIGDAKLLGVIGAWTGPDGALMTLFAGAVVASIVGLILIAVGVIERKRPIPFGPFLATAGLVMYLFKSEIIRLWIG